MARKLPWISEHFLLNRQFERVDDITEEAGEEEEDEEIETFKSKKTFMDKRECPFFTFYFNLEQVPNT